jgi:hypothetical protein
MKNKSCVNNPADIYIYMPMGCSWQFRVRDQNITELVVDPAAAWSVWFSDFGDKSMHVSPRLRALKFG